MKKQTQYANRAKAFAPNQNFGPAISEAAEPRGVTFSAIKRPNTPRWSEARPRLEWDSNIVVLVALQPLGIARRRLLA